MPKTMTLRLSDGLAEELAIIAEVEGVAMAQVIRAAIEADVEARRADAAYQTRLRAHLEASRAKLERLERGLRRPDGADPVTLRFALKELEIDASVSRTAKDASAKPTDLQP